MYNVEFSEQEMNYVLKAVDQLVRQTGLTNAATGLIVASKLQAAAAAAAAAKTEVSDQSESS